MLISRWPHPFLHTQRHQGDKGQSFWFVTMSCNAGLRHWVLSEFFLPTRSDSAALKTRLQSLHTRNNTALKTLSQSLHTQTNTGLQTCLTSLHTQDNAALKTHLQSLYTWNNAVL